MTAMTMIVVVNDCNSIDNDDDKTHVDDADANDNNGIINKIILLSPKTTTMIKAVVVVVTVIMMTMTLTTTFMTKLLSFQLGCWPRALTTAWILAMISTLSPAASGEKVVCLQRTRKVSHK